MNTAREALGEKEGILLCTKILFWNKSSDEAQQLNVCQLCLKERLVLVDEYSMAAKGQGQAVFSAAKLPTLLYIYLICYAT